MGVWGGSGSRSILFIVRAQRSKQWRGCYGQQDVVHRSGQPAAVHNDYVAEGSGMSNDAYKKDLKRRIKEQVRRGLLVSITSPNGKALCPDMIGQEALDIVREALEFHGGYTFERLREYIREAVDEINSET